MKVAKDLIHLKKHLHDYDDRNKIEKHYEYRNRQDDTKLSSIWQEISCMN
jgi:hypothetical protein